MFFDAKYLGLVHTDNIEVEYSEIWTIYTFHVYTCGSSSYFKLWEIVGRTLQESKSLSHCTAHT